LPSFFKDAHGDGIEEEGAVAVPFGALDPADGVGIGGCAQLTADDAAEVVGDDVVIANAAGLTMDAVEKLDKFERLDEEAGFFAHLAGDAFDEGFTDFKHAAGQRPMAFERFTAAAHEEHAAFVDDNRAHADEWGLRKLALYLLHARILRG